MERQLEEITEGKGAAIEGVINDLKEKGYIIKDVTGTGNKVSGINLSSDEIVIGKNSTETLIYTIVYEQKGDVKYFTEVDGKDYEIIFNNGEITVNTKETNLEDISNKPKVTIETSNSNIVEAKVIEEGKIELTSKEVVGNVEITIKEENRNVTKILTAIVKVMPEKLTLSSTEETIKRMSKIKLNATVEPSDVTDELKWSVENNDVVNIEDDGTVIGKNAGKTKVIVGCGDLTAECLIIVENGQVDFSSLDVAGYSLSDLFISVDKSSENAGFYEVTKKCNSIGFKLAERYLKKGWCNMSIRWNIAKFEEKFGTFNQLSGTIQHNDRVFTTKTVEYKTYDLDDNLLENITILNRYEPNRPNNSVYNNLTTDFEIPMRAQPYGRIEFRLYLYNHSYTSTDWLYDQMCIYLTNLLLK